MCTTWGSILKLTQSQLNEMNASTVFADFHAAVGSSTAFDFLMGRLPLKGAQDFERYCRENPETITQLGLSERINAALRLLDASGQPEPWTERPRLSDWECGNCPRRLGLHRASDC